MCVCECVSGHTNRFRLLKHYFSFCKCQVPSDLLDGVWNSVTHFSSFTCWASARLPSGRWRAARGSTWLISDAEEGEQTPGWREDRERAGLRFHPHSSLKDSVRCKQSVLGEFWFRFFYVNAWEQVCKQAFKSKFLMKEQKCLSSTADKHFHSTLVLFR